MPINFSVVAGMLSIRLKNIKQNAILKSEVSKTLRLIHHFQFLCTKENCFKFTLTESLLIITDYTTLKESKQYLPLKLLVTIKKNLSLDKM